MTNKTENKDIVVYKSNDGQISFGVNVFEETVWLTQKQMAELFDKDRKTITWHIGNVFKEGELDKNSVCWESKHTAEDGKTYNTTYYNLDVIISVGYRVKSVRGTQFRKWATGILKQYLMNGYAINNKRIKAIEEKIDNLSSEYFELKKELKTEITQINKSLLEIANRPITVNNQINNQISLASHKLEDRTIQLLDEIIKQIKNDQNLKNQLEKAKEDIIASPKDEKRKSKIIKFFNTLGDHNSNLHKTIEGAKISKEAIVELIKIGKKLKDFIF